MKKILASVLILCALICSFGCQESENAGTPSVEQNQPQDFEFAYQVLDGDFTRGKILTIGVEMTNRKSESYTWEGSSSHFQAQVKLVCADKEYEISPQDSPYTMDMGRHEIAVGESRTTQVYFAIPDDAASGEYDLVCSFEGTTKTFENAFVLRLVTQDELSVSLGLDFRYIYV